MTTIVVFADPPRPGLVLSDLVATTPLDSEQAADLYAAMLGDVLRAAADSGGDLLVNYRTEATIPEQYVESDEEVGDGELEEGDATGGNAERAVRALAEDVLDDPGAARYERQVGSTRAARIGNTVTHLLDTEEASSVAVVDATVPFLERGDLDGLAMKLRRSEVVLAPASRGRVAYAGFGEPIDFEGASEPPALGMLTDRGLDAGHDVDYAAMRPVVETGTDLQGALATIEAHKRAGRTYPERTAATLDEIGVMLRRDDDLALSIG